ncbi:DUF3575 domain-containing protein [Chryseobacterium sp. cx-311]|uniref:DUF3575 domain-containing protein n=1 Tax=Marnyiella aurantia TaxID=2758037 RepID=UPI001AE92DD7|nr:DUF3575 domain-containing protein [Marnyiella aurantia]MBP0611464.1 DUF3575 domain-containing protein [Marnyiella aurantia]
MKRLCFALLCFTVIFASAQDTEDSKSLYVKGNAVLLPVGVLNVGAEYQLNNKFTLQADALVSPWKSFSGHQAQLYMLGMDGRYYFDRAFRRWYVGLNISALRFIAQKPNYWGEGPYQLTPNSPIYNKSDLYQDGYAVLIGAVAGYQFQISEKWNIDLFVAGGNAQSLYRGYHENLGIRYDELTGWNRSGEWIPYRGGVMISYKLR